MGLDPARLFAFTFRQLANYSKGHRKEREIKENQIRKFAYLFAQANRDPKKSFPRLKDFWPLELLDETEEMENEENSLNSREIKEKLLKAWKLSKN